MVDIVGNWDDSDDKDIKLELEVMNGNGKIMITTYKASSN